MGGATLGNTLSSLNDDEVRQISQIIEALDRSSFEFLKLEVGDLTLVVSKGDVTSILVAELQRPATPSPQPTAAPVATSFADQTEASSQVAEVTGASEGTVTINAPSIGQFYAQSEPGAAPFVSVGSEVTEDTTVGLIEVMKMFSAVVSGVSGVITEICVQNAQLVEYGQVLFRVRPNRVA